MFMIRWCKKKFLGWDWVRLLENLGKFRKFAKLKIVLKVENRSFGRFLFWGAFVVAEFGFCRCVRVFWGLKLVLFSCPCFGVVFGVCGVRWGGF